MQYSVSFGDRLLALPAMCRTFPIGQHLPPYLEPNHTPIQMQDQKRAPLAEGIGGLANVMAKEWMIRFIKDAELDHQPASMSDSQFEDHYNTYRVFETVLHSQRQDSLAQICSSVEIIGTLV